MINYITEEYYKENLEWYHYRDQSIGVIKLPSDYSIELILPESFEFLVITFNKGTARLYTGGTSLPEEVQEAAEKISYQNYIYEKRIPDLYIKTLIAYINNLIKEHNEEVKL